MRWDPAQRLAQCPLYWTRNKPSTSIHSYSDHYSKQCFQMDVHARFNPLSGRAALSPSRKGLADCVIAGTPRPTPFHKD